MVYWKWGLNITNLTIYGELPSMNQIINANRYSRFSGGDQKRVWTTRMSIVLKEQMKDDKLDDGPYWFNFVWYRKTKRTDPDNISGAGMKFIFDGMQKAKIMDNDGWKQVAGFEHHFKIDKDNPRVEISITKM